ncbi:MAG: anaerobic ribonucleoside-triphosphate reductase activating protein [Deltaproteobacteria bacterium]|jgi:pyruvate formate lyase activating enzyme|nr:anaerobic ribonucleoside-triphosphate reductase activating protein [Deltaproteobacteria bacterium]
MRIGGLQKTTMLDFPGKVSALVFTQGCNFLCPYCHNPDLVLYGQESLSLPDIIAFLAQRRKVLEGVVISGGEPTLHDGLFSFCATLKSLGYAIKLDTNGSRPEALRRLLRAELVDYVAMDVKAHPEQYPAALCAQSIGRAIPRSMALLRESRIAHEFRVPCVAPFINADSLTAIMEHVGHAPLFLQTVRLERVLQADFFPGQGHALDRESIARLCEAVRQNGLHCQIR